MAGKTVQVSEQQAADIIAQEIGVQVDNQGNIRTEDPGKARGRMQDVGFEQKMASMKVRLRATGVHPATVFNFLPIVVIVNSPMQAVRGGVLAVKHDELFASRTWKEVDIQPFHDGDLGRVPHEFHPLQIAEAFQAEFPHGGVLALMGGREAAEKPENRNLVEKAKRDANKWMLGQVANGDAKWNAPNSARRHTIMLQERESARRLVAIGVMKALPAWVDAPSMDMQEAPAACGKCGTVPDNRNALSCIKCGWILDPEQAYINGVINEEDESLERLTRAQVKTLGISAYVSETSDEKPGRVKAGLPRPVSEAYMRAEAAAKAVEQPQQRT